MTLRDVLREAILRGLSNWCEKGNLSMAALADEVEAAVWPVLHPLDELLEVFDRAEGRTPLVSNQGQAMDGYTELAAYRAVLRRGGRG